MRRSLFFWSMSAKQTVCIHTRAARLCHQIYQVLSINYIESSC